MTNTDTTETFSRVLVIAHQASGLSNAEFDYSLASDDRSLAGARNWIGNAVSQVARERGQDAEQLAAELYPHLQARVAYAKSRSYLGWSSAARARGHKIRYA